MENQSQNSKFSQLNSPEMQNIVKSDEQLRQQIIKLSQQCIQAYQNHEIDTAYKLLKRIQIDLKNLSTKGFAIALSDKHFRQDFLILVPQIQRQYQDMIDFNNEILTGNWIVKKQKQGFKVSSKYDGNSVGVLLQAKINFPFQYVISVVVQPELYKYFIGWIKKSQQVKHVSRNRKIGSIQIQLPVISNRQAIFQGTLYNRLIHQNKQNQQIFLYNRSIHNREDLQQKYKSPVKLNQKCVSMEYKYIVIKYKPINQKSGYLTLGMNIDLKLKWVPMYLIQLGSITFCEDFYNNLVRVSQIFKGSYWQKKIKEDPHLYQFTKKILSKYLKQNQILNK